MTLEGVAETTEETAGSRAHIAVHRARGVLACRGCSALGHVASAASADVVDGAIL